MVTNAKEEDLTDVDEAAYFFMLPYLTNVSQSVALICEDLLSSEESMQCVVYLP